MKFVYVLGAVVAIASLGAYSAPISNIALNARAAEPEPESDAYILAPRLVGKDNLIEKRSNAVAQSAGVSGSVVLSTSSSFVLSSASVPQSASGAGSASPKVVNSRSLSSTGSSLSSSISGAVEARGVSALNPRRAKKRTEIPEAEE